MRYPEAKIKQAILHPEEEVREQALHYFSDAHSQDDTVMPLVIHAVEKYGRDTAFAILRDAEDLVQTDATIEWLMGELQRDFNTRKIDDDNYRYAVAMVLAGADPRLLAAREADILALPAFPKPLRGPLHERIEMLSWGWERTWEALLHFGIDTMRRQEVTQNDLRYGKRLTEALARHRDQADLVLRLLKRPYTGKDRALVLWLEPHLMTLAGEMGIKAAIPRLMMRVKQGEDELIDSAFEALERLGGDAVVRAVSQEWWDPDEDLRCSFASMLEDIHTDLCVAKCRRFLKHEDDPEVELILANALLGNFVTDAIELIWPLVDGIAEDELVPDQRDLRYRLVSIAVIMGQTFPRFQVWRKAALRDNWGKFHAERIRLADVFRPDVPGPKWSLN